MRKKLIFIFLLFLLFFTTGCSNEKYEYEVFNYYYHNNFYHEQLPEQHGVILTKYLGKSHDIVIPEYVDGHKVVSIDSYFFRSLKELEYINSFKIPDYIKFIASGPYESDLEEFDYGQEWENGICYLDGWALKANFENISNLEFREGTRGIAPSFDSCLNSELKNIIIDRIYIPGSVKSIIPFTFKDIFLAKEIYIDEGLEYICNLAFEINVAEIKDPIKIHLPDTLKYLGNNCFGSLYNSPKGTSIYVPKNVEYIGDGAVAFGIINMGMEKESFNWGDWKYSRSPQVINWNCKRN